MTNPENAQQESKQYLFLFNIASPQAFISQARKTHDLWAGSVIISELIDSAMDKAGKANVIFPHAESISKPNRFLAKIVTNSIQQWGEEIEKATRTKWLKISAEAFKAAGVSEDLKKIDAKLIDFLSLKSCLETIEKVSTIAKQQIFEFPDIYWAAVEYNEKTDNYKEKHDELNRLLGEVKNVRQFCQLNETEGSRKCVIDGERTALFYRKSERGSTPGFLSTQAIEIQHHKLSPNEALSAVSLVKRFYKKDNEKSFPSTAEIALMNVITEETIREYRKNFKGDFDFQLCYEENLTEAALNKSGIELSNGKKLSEVQKACKELTSKNQIRSKYYAILLFDGDSFGKLWSGEPLKDTSQLEAFQKQLANNLNEFAKSARGYLDSPKGKTVYTGGDDFLGFVNLSSLFDVLKILREKFDELVECPLKEYLKNGERITFTAGITIAHYKAPLREVLNKTREVEKKAKNEFKDRGKDAIGIAVMKGSGEINEAYLKFYPKNTAITPPADVNSIHLIEQIIAELKSDNGFSNKFIKSFEKEMQTVTDKEGVTNIYSPAISIELKRLLERSSRQVGKEKEESVKSFYTIVNSLRQVSGSEKISNFNSLLNICVFIEREVSTDNKQ
jgi:CRISPR-associated protein Cmr2